MRERETLTLNPEAQRRFAYSRLSTAVGGAARVQTGSCVGDGS